MLTKFRDDVEIEPLRDVAMPAEESRDCLRRVGSARGAVDRGWSVSVNAAIEADIDDPERLDDCVERGAPWPSEDQIEQDLILSRLLVEIASDRLLSEELAFRGGTCLHKLHLEEPQRYSEDLDFVRTNQQPILGEIFDGLRAIAERIGLREHRWKLPSEASDMAHISFDEDAESGQSTIRVKIETNVAESEPHRGTSSFHSQ